jgi:hypothetical protein
MMAKNTEQTLLIVAVAFLVPINLVPHSSLFLILA